MKLKMMRFIVLTILTTSFCFGQSNETTPRLSEEEISQIFVEQEGLIGSIFDLLQTESLNIFLPTLGQLALEMGLKAVGQPYQANFLFFQRLQETSQFKFKSNMTIAEIKVGIGQEIERLKKEARRFHEDAIYKDQARASRANLYKKENIQKLIEQLVKLIEREDGRLNSRSFRNVRTLDNHLAWERSNVNPFKGKPIAIKWGNNKTLMSILDIFTISEQTFLDLASRRPKFLANQYVLPKLVEQFGTEATFRLLRDASTTSETLLLDRIDDFNEDLKLLDQENPNTSLAQNRTWLKRLKMIKNIGRFLTVSYIAYSVYDSVNFENELDSADTRIEQMNSNEIDRETLRNYFSDILMNSGSIEEAIQKLELMKEEIELYQHQLQIIQEETECE